MRKDEPIRIDTGRRGDQALTQAEVTHVMHWAFEAKNRRVDAVLIQPGIKGGRLFIKPCHFTPTASASDLEL